jgi:hypothetical protein
MDVAETTVAEVAKTPPMLTVAPVIEPVAVMDVPSALEPLLGLMLVKVGGS